MQVSFAQEHELETLPKPPPAQSQALAPVALPTLLQELAMRLQVPQVLTQVPQPPALVA